ncbi:hypothetical protein BDZ89DRAFT_1079922 [Hymenopellis radicata]|nr:hypothetical protein BDZ89DRAFT_1079922 [Hymenopellis radicata]
MPKAVNRTLAKRKSPRGNRTRRASTRNARIESDTLQTNVNTKGLPTLPVELHLEIMSYFPRLPVPCLTFGPILPGEYRDRFDALLSLSQTCSALCHIYYPLLWHTIEACALRTKSRTEMQTAKPMAMELVFQLEVVTIRAPASPILVFNVALTPYSSSTVYEEFARGLSCLPNLHTLQLVSCPNFTTKQGATCLQHFKAAFSKIPPLTNIHTLAMPVYVLSRFESALVFPCLRHIALNDWVRGYSSDLSLSRLLRSYPHVQMLSLPTTSLVRLANGTEIAALADHFPQLRVTPRLSMRTAHQSDFLNMEEGVRTLGQLERLHIVKFEYFEPFTADIESLITMATELILQNLAREVNKDVSHGKVEIWAGSTFERAVTVTRPGGRMTDIP